jgi:hypothetical protein
MLATAARLRRYHLGPRTKSFPLAISVLALAVLLVAVRSESTRAGEAQAAKVEYEHGGLLSLFNIPCRAKAYSASGTVIATMRCPDTQEFPEDPDGGKQFVCEEVHYADDGSSAIRYRGIAVFNMRTGRVTERERREGSRLYTVFDRWPTGRPVPVNPRSVRRR